MANSADPDQLASAAANWSGSRLFAKTGHDVFSKRRVNFPQMHKIIANVLAFATPTSNVQPIRLLEPGCWCKFAYLMANSADLDQLHIQKYV